jgi:siderophore ferric iron reductase
VSNPELSRLLMLVEQLVPGLRAAQGESAPAGALRLEDAASFEALCRHWARAYPEAGPHYLALRCWGLAIWQPIYLSVIAVHMGGAVPCLIGLAQPVAQGFPNAVLLPQHVPRAAPTLTQRISLAAEELRALCQATRAALAASVNLHARAAERLQAECVLGALLCLRRAQPALADLEALGAQWLAPLGIAGGCGFFAYRARDGTAALALDRKVCCHHFRRRDGEYCSTCPKLPLDARIGRLQAEPA